MGWDDRVLFLWPHQDDDVLWTAFSLMREAEQGARVTCVTVFESHLQEQRGTGITHAQRLSETHHALVELGVIKEWEGFSARSGNPPSSGAWQQWAFRDDAPDWPALRGALLRLAASEAFARVYAPAVEVGGHAQHNGLGEAAMVAWPDARLVRYLSYTRTHGKSRGGRVVGYAPAMVTRKLRALAAYTSQIENEGAMSTEHFTRDLLEYIV